MRHTFFAIVGLALCLPWLAPPALATSMKSTAPERMLSRADSKKMRACDDRAVRENVPMEQRAAFVKKCMKEMK
ncbi:MAG TPA: hypothetical protein VHQ92_15215 [Pseudolabrys sp.]|jgi:hypothetical protein|nr:hypothetical protein [Pseudolabrys sp.]